MNEQEYIAILWKFVGGSVAAFGAIGLAVMRWISNKLDRAATKEELEKVEKDLRTEIEKNREAQQHRDDKVDNKLDSINDAVTGTHKRVDELYRHLIGNSPR